MKVKTFVKRKSSIDVWCLAAALLLFACAESEPFPKELIGTWVTDAPLYTDRFIEIDETWIVFGTGEVEPNTFFIKSFKSQLKNGSVLWVFKCELSPGEEFDISVVYNPDEAYEKLRMANNPWLGWYQVEE